MNCGRKTNRKRIESVVHLTENEILDQTKRLIKSSKIYILDPKQRQLKELKQIRQFQYFKIAHQLLLKICPLDSTFMKIFLMMWEIAVNENVKKIPYASKIQLSKHLRIIQSLKNCITSTGNISIEITDCQVRTIK